MEGSLYIIDALNYLYRAFHAMPPLQTTTGIPTGAIYGMCQMLFRIERSERPTHICLVLDAPGKTFRDAMYPEYKAHRPPMPPELAQQIPLVEKVIAAFGLPVLSVPGVEADDVIATLARQADAAGVKVVICSSDKDLLQLVGGGISVLDTMKNRFLGPQEVHEKFGVAPDKVGDVLALMGDSVDNVPGVPGVGPKTAAEYINKYGSLDELLARAGEIKGKKGEALVVGRESALLSRRLVQLKEDVPLPRTLNELRRSDPDADHLAALFREFEFTRLLAEVQAGQTPTPQVAAEQPVEMVSGRGALEDLVSVLGQTDGVGVAVLTHRARGSLPVIVGLAFAIADGRRWYIPLGHRVLGAPVSLREAEALAILAPVLGAQRPGKYVHAAKSLELPLLNAGFSLVGLASDPLLAAYVLDPSSDRHDLDVLAQSLGFAAPPARAAWLGTGKNERESCDVEPALAATPLGREAFASLQLGEKHRQALETAGLTSLYRDVEIPLCHVLARLEHNGIRLDVTVLREIGQEVSHTIATLEAEIQHMAGTSFNIASPKQLADILFGKLGLPIVRKTKTGASTDVDVLEELAALHPVPAKIVEYRMLTKLRGTYIDALPGLVHPATGRLHTTFHQAVAATGRLSSSDPNLQNIPIRSALGRRIRQAFVADPGFLLVSADYSQIELRVLAHFSEDPAFLEAFRSGQDIHQRTAAEIFAVPHEAVTPEQRRVAKAINFGLVFGQTDFGLAQALRIPRAQARVYIDSYFGRYSGVRRYMEQSIAAARTAGSVSTLFGRRRPIPELRSSRAPERAHGERIARNTPIQGTAADLLKMAMIRVDAGLSRWKDARFLLTIHDELIFEVHDGDVPAFSSWVKAEMENVAALKVPLVVDVGSGRTWSDAH